VASSPTTKEHYRRPAEQELAYFRTWATDEEAVSKAALAQLSSGKRHSHQYRVPPAALRESERRLLDNLPALRKASSFDELLQLMETLIRPIHRIGELAVYDTAVRVGARFAIEPAKVYLHAGTRKGAKALGLNARSDAIELTELPVELRTLTAGEAEDVLCIYKNEFAGLRERRPRDRHVTGCLPRGQARGRC
jgi:hypothetical protein